MRVERSKYCINCAMNPLSQDARLNNMHDISQTLRSLQANLITFILVVNVKFEQAAEALPIAEDEAKCSHPHLL